MKYALATAFAIFPAGSVHSTGSAGSAGGPSGGQASRRVVHGKVSKKASLDGMTIADGKPGASSGAGVSFGRTEKEEDVNRWLYLSAAVIAITFAAGLANAGETTGLSGGGSVSAMPTSVTAGSTPSLIEAASRLR
jgi:hypothetical protein